MGRAARLEVIPARAGIQDRRLDPDLRRGDAMSRRIVG